MQTKKNFKSPIMSRVCTGKIYCFPVHRNASVLRLVKIIKFANVKAVNIVMCVSYPVTAPTIKNVAIAVGLISNFVHTNMFHMIKSQVRELLRCISLNYCRLTGIITVQAIAGLINISIYMVIYTYK